jgi:Cu-Zn family superoxide dismutase
MIRLITAAVLAAIPLAALAQNDSELSTPIVATGGTPAGTLEMRDTANGVLLSATFEPGVLPAGPHAVHFHEKGDCSDTEKFETAGGHHNPTGAEHGYFPEGGPHAGDLPNFVIVEGQTTALSTFSAHVRFRDGDAPLFDADGSALVVHAGADDYESQPSGASGDRIACAEIKAQ